MIVLSFCLLIVVEDLHCEGMDFLLEFQTKLRFHCIVKQKFTLMFAIIDEMYSKG